MRKFVTVVALASTLVLPSAAFAGPHGGGFGGAGHGGFGHGGFGHGGWGHGGWGHGRWGHGWRYSGRGYSWVGVWPCWRRTWTGEMIWVCD